jgi:hypothetical protein
MLTVKRHCFNAATASASASGLNRKLKKKKVFINKAIERSKAIYTSLKV